MSTGIGETLREARAAQGSTIEDAARATRVRSDYIRALEDEQFDMLGGDVYAKGFLKSYAQFLGLDPEPLLETYRRQFATDEIGAKAMAATPAVTASPPRAAPPAWIAWVMVAALMLVALFFVGNVFGGRTPEPVADDALASGEEDTASEEPTAQPSETVTEPTPPPSPSPPAAFEGVDLLLVFDEDCWVDVEIDGQQIERGTVPSGETRSFQAEEAITIRFGNAGGVRVELGGEDLGAPGGRGEVLTVTFTEDGAQQAT